MIVAVLGILVAVIAVIVIAIVNGVTKNKEWKMTCNHCGTVWYVNKKSYMNQSYAARSVNDLCACPNCRSKNAKKENVI